MPYARPTLTQLRHLALQDIVSADLPGVDGLLRKAVFRVLSWGFAGMAYLHYCYQDWIAGQAVPWSCTDEYAAGWAGLKGVTRKAATYAVVTGVFPGGVSGTDVPAGTLASRKDAYVYTSLADATVDASGNATLSLKATITGSGGNADVGTLLTLTNGLGGVGANGTVTAATVIGADIETPEAFKTRFLAVYAAPPAGGAQTDYVEWAETVPGVTRAWCNPNGAGAGTVVIYVMLDVAEAAYGGFPQGANGVAASEPRAAAATGDQLIVANALFAQRPVTALVYVCAPIAYPVNFTLTNVLPATAAMQAQIQAALTDMFLRLGSPTGATIYPSDWNAALDSIGGLLRYDVTSPTVPVTTAVGYLPTLGTLSVGG